LSPEAQVSVVTADQTWSITNPLVPTPTVNPERQVFVVSTAAPPMPTGYMAPPPQSPTPTSLLYVTFDQTNPAMNPGWADFTHSLNPAGDGINWNQVNGPP